LQAISAAPTLDRMDGKIGQGFQITADQQRAEFMSGNAAFVLPHEMAHAAMRCIVLPILGKKLKAPLIFCRREPHQAGPRDFELGVRRSGKPSPFAGIPYFCISNKCPVVP
jgi:hypothetical protein